MTKRLPLFLALAALLAGCASPATPPVVSTLGTLTHIKLAMGFIPDIQFAPFYVADAKGYFRDQGLQVEFATMYENDAVPLLGANDLQFAIVSAEQIIEARSQGLPVKYVMKWWEKYPIAVTAKAAKGIKTPKDLAGRKVGIPGLYGASYIGWQALLNAQSLPADTARLEAIGFTQAQALTADTVDAAVVYANNEPVKLAAQGQVLTTLLVSDYVQLASNGLATNDKTIADHPDLVQGMVSAILKGISDTQADPAAAVQTALKYISPAPDAAIARKVLEASLAMWQTTEPGVSERARWQTTQDVLLKMKLIPAAINLDDAYTNIFIPAY
jgi:NitT/TauT family transport system substrate-binding protein